MLFISPPFGNYISLPYTMSIKGSYTLEPRSGLFQQILKTFRYSFHHKGWINKNNLWGVYMLEIYKVRFYQPLLNFYWKLRLKFNY